MRYTLEPLRLLHNSKNLERDTEKIMFSLRSAIRLQVSHIEATCYLLRRMLLALTPEELSPHFDRAGLLMLEDKKLDRDDGSLTRQAYPYLKTNITKSFHNFGKVCTNGFILKKDQGWQCFLKIAQIRNLYHAP